MTFVDGEIGVLRKAMSIDGWGQKVKSLLEGRMNQKLISHSLSILFGTGMIGSST